MKLFFTSIFATMLGLLFCLGVAGCQTAPNATQQTGLTVLIDAAVGVAVQNGSKDPEVWAQRAGKVISIAKQLQALDKGAIATLPAVTSALAPLIAQAALGPAEQLAANALIAALSQVIQQNAGNVTLPTQAAIQLVLADVIAAASVYVPISS